jgi:hypothetical protein
MRRAAIPLLVCACGPAVGTDDTGDTTGGSSDGDTTTGPGIVTISTTTTPADTSGPEPTGTTSSSSSNDDSNDDGPQCVLHHPEIATPGDCYGDAECCPGEKCVPSVDYSACVPLDDTPAGIGEPCVRTGVSDDCVAGTVCRGSTADTNEGRCVEFCALGHDCSDASTICTDEPLQLCLVPCDPLGEACPGTDLCLPMNDAQTFACLPDETPTTAGAASDPCPVFDDAFSGCDVGHVCVADAYVDIMQCAADDESGCCTALCATDDPLACAGIGAETCVPLSMLVGDPWPDALGVGYCG